MPMKSLSPVIVSFFNIYHGEVGKGFCNGRPNFFLGTPEKSLYHELQDEIISYHLILQHRNEKLCHFAFAKRKYEFEI